MLSADALTSVSNQSMAKITTPWVPWVVGLVVLAAAGGTGWFAWVIHTSVPLPRIRPARAEVIDPDAPGPVFVEYDAPKPGAALADLVAEADAVLTADLRDGRVDLVQWPPNVEPTPPALPYSVYYFTVRDVVKGDFRFGDTIKVARVGGRASYESEFPRPGLGEQFLMFLRKDPEMQAYTHLYGRVAFRVVWGELQSMGPRYREVTGRKVQDVVKELRRGVQDAKQSAARQ